ncbi:hypothetical protein J437_LFUL004007 [Ladona fulva]|uniref:Uncharacterized protein n=1 Tax=Ladona fulva TaxID=123851 RepID=A0A8K0JXC1_LADFU|nr:hypothetical protein J437_LFUL004007 [Ladona fulva]
MHDPVDCVRNIHCIGAPISSGPPSIPEQLNSGLAAGSSTTALVRASSGNPVGQSNPSYYATERPDTPVSIRGPAARGGSNAIPEGSLEESIEDSPGGRLMRIDSIDSEAYERYTFAFSVEVVFRHSIHTEETLLGTQRVNDIPRNLSFQPMPASNADLKSQESKRLRNNRADNDLIPAQDRTVNVDMFAKCEATLNFFTYVCALRRNIRLSNEDC